MAADEADNRADPNAPEASPGNPGDPHSDPFGGVLDDLLDEATSSLRDDEELRLDVRAELASHLEDRREDYLAKGHSPEEALDLARQSFGAPDEIARDLLAANRRRMKLRALARIALRAVVVPAGMVAVFLFASMTYLGIPLTSIAHAFGWSEPTNLGEKLSFVVQYAETRRWTEFSAEDKLLVYGESGLAEHRDRIGAIWKAYPSRPEFCADYLASFAGDMAKLQGHFAGRHRGRNGRGWPQEHVDYVGKNVAEDMAWFESDMARARALDPDNAFFDYLQSAVLAAGGCREEVVPPTDEDRARKPLVMRTKFVVVDRELLERATKALLSGDAKPRFESYAVEVRRTRLAVAMSESGVSGILRRLFVWCGSTRALGSGFVRQVPSLAAWAEALAAEGRREEALRILDATTRMFIRTMTDASDVRSAWNIFRLCGAVEERVPPVYERLGRSAEAARLKTLAAEAKPLAEAAAWGEDEDAWENVRIRGGNANSYLLRSTWLDCGVLATAREIDQLLLDRAGASLLLITLFALAAGCAFVSVRWRLTRSVTEAIPPLLPRPFFLARSLGLGVLLPLAAFCMYAQWSGISGREYSLEHLGHRFLLEIVLFVATVAAILVSLTRTYVRDRCADLGTPTPNRAPRQLRAGLWAALGVAWVSCLAMRGEGSWRAAHVIITAIMCLAVLCLSAELVHVAGRRRRFTAYYAALARTLVGVFAAAALVAACVTALHFRDRSGRIAARAEAFEIDEELQVPRADARMFRALRSDLARAVREFEAETTRDE